MISLLPLLAVFLTPTTTLASGGADTREEREQMLALELPSLRTADLARWRDSLRPNGDESVFEALPWELTFAGGVVRAQEEGKPLLFWAMNGHPLGCT